MPGAVKRETAIRIDRSEVEALRGFASEDSRIAAARDPISCDPRPPSVRK
jgi:hypothetical protein